MDKSKLLAAQALAIQGIIYAPASFLLASPQQLEWVCNGCGAADSWFRPPPKVYGTDIVAACIVHDWMYGHGCTIEDKEEADRTFFNNMIRLVERDRVKWYKPTSLQHRRVYKYYKAVDLFGGPAFWAGKNAV